MIRSTFAIPAIIAAATIGGLASALAGDGLADIPSWIGLALPAAAFAWAWARRRHR